MKKVISSVRGKWGAVEAGTRIMLLVGVLGIAVTGYVLYQRSTQVDWAVLYANVDDATASTVLAGLDSHGIPHQVEGNGTRILVPRSELTSSRLALAGDGISSTPQPQGFDEIFSQQGLASSDFEQRVNYQRALEGELARTLLAMEPVKGARVQLSIPEPSLFVGSSSTTAATPTASVMLSLRRDLTRAESDTVANIVASSVQGLSVDQVTIASSDGTMLRSPGTSASGSGGGEANMLLATDFENSLSARLTSLARTLTGQAGATVEVRAAFDFTQSTIEKDQIDPTKNTPTAQRETTEKWTGSGAQAGGATGVDGGPTVSGGSDGTYEKTDKTITFVPGDRTITKSSITTPSVSRLSVAVVVPEAAAADGAAATPSVDEETLRRVLGSAAGIVASRGDTIEVATVKAAATDTGGLITDPASPGGSTSASNASEPPIDLFLAAAGAGAFVMLLLSLIGRRARRKGARAGRVDGGGRRKKKKGKGDDIDVTEVMPRIDTGMPMDPDRQAVEEIKHDLERMVSESPESLAALLSTWMAK